MKVFFTLLTLASLSLSSFAQNDFYKVNVVPQNQTRATDLTTEMLKSYDYISEYAAYSMDDYACRQAWKFIFVKLRPIYENGEGLIDKDVLRILHAAKFAAYKHRHQTRKNLLKTPYIIHPLGVAIILLDNGVRDADILMGALLHDTVEDTNASFEEIEELFGSRVSSFVRELTDNRSLPKEQRKALQIIHAPGKSAGAAQIKLADKLYNLTDLFVEPPYDWSKDRVNAYFDWAEKVTQALPWVNGKLYYAIEALIRAHRARP